MKSKKTLAQNPYLLLAPVLLALFAGCVSEAPMAVVLVTYSNINGHAIHLNLDTGAGSTILFGSGADHAGLKYAPPVVNAVQEKASVDLALSDVTNITMNKQNFTAPLPVFDTPWYIGWALSILNDDGVVGWPEVRDNILSFNSDKRAVIALGAESFNPDELLKDGWQKYKISWGDQLMLEIPLADGKTGTILVDTGSPMGVGVPAAQYKEWRSANPKALSTDRGYYMPGVGVIDTEEAWADEIKIGSLALTDVPVQEVPADEASGVASSGIDNFSGTIGLYGLTRMNLIVDGKNGYAYIKARPAPGLAYPGIDRPGFKFERGDEASGDKNWVLTTTVHLQADNLYFASGAFNYERGDFPGAINDLSQALAINPRNSMAHYALGMVRQCQGNFTGAVAEYDLALALPERTTPVEFDYVSLYRESLQLRQGRASAEFAQSLTRWRDGWTQKLGRYLIGELDEKALLAAAQKSDIESVLGQQCEAYYFIGVQRLLKGDQAGAREYWQKCLNTGEKAYDEYPFARADLASLDAAVLAHP